MTTCVPMLVCSYFYPRPPRGGRPIKMPRKHLTRDISIHALREEGDWLLTIRFRLRTNFYPRPPRGGRRCRPS